MARGKLGRDDPEGTKNGTPAGAADNAGVVRDGPEVGTATKNAEASWYNSGKSNESSKVTAVNSLAARC